MNTQPSGASAAQEDWEIETFTPREILHNGSVSLDFSYELGILDLEKRINDNTTNSNRAFIVEVSYLKRLNF